MKKKQKNTFKTPKNYFDNFNERLMGKIGEEESLIPKSDGFIVPENYFGTVLKNSTAKLNEANSGVISLNKYKKYYLAAAAISAIFITILGFNLSATATVDFEDLAHTDLDTYFDDNSIDLSSYELVDYIATEDITLENNITTIQENTILDYLNENIDELDDLNNLYEEFE